MHSPGMSHKKQHPLLRRSRVDYSAPARSADRPTWQETTHDLTVMALSVDERVSRALDATASPFLPYHVLLGRVSAALGAVGTGESVTSECKKLDKLARLSPWPPSVFECRFEVTHLLRSLVFTRLLQSKKIPTGY